MISIIIPFKDKIELLAKCVFSVLEKTTYNDYEIILVDNQSIENATKLFLKKIKNNPKIKILSYNKPFNFSAINNFAVQYVEGEFVLFLNNDTEVISENWLTEMIKCFEDKKVGVVGAKLLYPNGTIQHCGVELDKKNVAIHSFYKMKENDLNVGKKIECQAVTGACMLTRKKLFLNVDGFDEINLPIAYNDVDYCLKVGNLNLSIICISNIKLYHHESASRKSDILARIFNKKRYKEFLRERSYLKSKWKIS